MINLRYHIVSLVAVFLALGLGILMGSTVIDQGIVSRLKVQTNALEKNLDAQRAQNDALTRQQGLWESFAREALARFTRGRLTGRTVTLVVEADADAGMIGGITQAVDEAGAVVEGRVNLTDKWNLKDETTRRQLALGLGIPVAGADDLLGDAAGRLGGRLGQS